MSMYICLPCGACSGLPDYRIRNLVCQQGFCASAADVSQQGFCASAAVVSQRVAREVPKTVPPTKASCNISRLLPAYPPCRLTGLGLPPAYRIWDLAGLHRIRHCQLYRWHGLPWHWGSASLLDLEPCRLTGYGPLPAYQIWDLAGSRAFSSQVFGSALPA